MKKYPPLFGDQTPISKEEAIKQLEAFVVTFKEKNTKSTVKSFHLYLEKDKWITYTDSTKKNAKGKFIKKFMLV